MGDQALRRFAVTSISTFISGLYERRDDQQRGGRADVAENFAADREVRIRIAGVGDVIGRADDVGHREAALLQRGLDGLEAVA